MDLATEASVLQAKVAEHNAAIRAHRKARQQAVRQLADINRVCREHGIPLTVAPQHSKGAVHGRTSDT